MIRFKRVALAISGGVDSAVAAFLLKTKGYDVQAVYMQNWDIRDELGNCRADEDYRDAGEVCNLLNIPIRHVNFVKQYWNEVFSNLIKEYESGSTPNPDILCNKNIKFNYFCDYAFKQLNADAIATGHYAKTNFGPYLEYYTSDELVRLLRAVDTKKDQTFFLSQIKQESLRKTMFPLGDLLKSDVKAIARKIGLDKFANKKESMGICFIGIRNFQNFISEYVVDKKGKFIDVDTGKVVGEHNGIHQWTIGQRTKISGAKKPYFTMKKDAETNIIYVAAGNQHPALYSRLMFTSQPHWIHSRPPELENKNIFDCEFKFQHIEDLVTCTVCETLKGLIIFLHNEKRALTPGQFAVLYKNNECLGSARIIYAGPSNFNLYWLQNKKIMNVTKLLERYKKLNSQDKISDIREDKCNVDDELVVQNL